MKRNGTVRKRGNVSIVFESLILIATGYGSAQALEFGTSCVRILLGGCGLRSPFSASNEFWNCDWHVRRDVFLRRALQVPNLAIFDVYLTTI